MKWCAAKVEEERKFYVISKLMNNALMGVPYGWLCEQMAMADVSFHCDFGNCYILLTGPKRSSYQLAGETEVNSFDSEYRIKAFLKSKMEEYECRYDFFYHYMTKEQVLFFTPKNQKFDIETLSREVHDFVTREIRKTMPNLSARQNNVTVISDWIDSYEKLGQVYDAISYLKSCVFFHMKSDVFSRRQYESLHKPVTFNEIQTEIKQIESMIINGKYEEARSKLNAIMLEQLRWSFDTKLAAEICVLLRGMLLRWQKAYAFYLDDELIGMIAPEKCLSIEELANAARAGLNYAIEQIEKCGGPIHPLTQEALEVIRQSHGVDLTLADIAMYLHVSSAHLSRIFKKDMGISFSDYIQKEKLSYAKNLLENERYGINEIARMIGMEDSTYFYKFFRRFTGITPGNYRDSLRDLKNLEK